MLRSALLIDVNSCLLYCLDNGSSQFKDSKWTFSREILFVETKCTDQRAFFICLVIVKFFFSFEILTEELC